MEMLYVVPVFVIVFFSFIAFFDYSLRKLRDKKKGDFPESETNQIAKADNRGCYCCEQWDETISEPAFDGGAPCKILHKTVLYNELIWVRLFTEPTFLCPSFSPKEEEDAEIDVNLASIDLSLVEDDPPLFVDGNRPMFEEKGGMS